MSSPRKREPMPEFFDERERLAHMEAPALEAVQRLEGLADADLIK